jgi:hypothetical protein
MLSRIDRNQAVDVSEPEHARHRRQTTGDRGRGEVLLFFHVPHPQLQLRSTRFDGVNLHVVALSQVAAQIRPVVDSGCSPVAGQAPDHRQAGPVNTHIRSMKKDVVGFHHDLPKQFRNPSPNSSVTGDIDTNARRTGDDHHTTPTRAPKRGTGANSTFL